MNKIPVLIIGAGPTGLVLALSLTKQGVPVRIVDKALSPGTSSRALVVHARTLEFYHQLGISSKILEKSLKFSSANLWIHGKKEARIPLGDIGIGLSRFPYMTIFPQDEHEALLIAELNQLGVQVQRGIELVDFEQSDHVRVRLKHENGKEEVCETKYLAGCDGARSQVRKISKMDFKGTTYSQFFYVADVTAAGPNIDQELHLSLDDADFVAIFPLKEKNHIRLIGIADESSKTPDRDFIWDDVKHLALNRLKINITNIKWFSTYKVHHRLAEKFQNNLVFLLGDAAHIHSPVGGQGMNTGIGDAFNLSWKLAAVLKNELHERLLSTYEPERMNFAKRLVATTDRAFSLISSTGSLANFVRLNLAAPILQFITQFKFVRRFIFRTISQISIKYRFSSLSMKSMSKIKAGDRLPWDEDPDPLPMVWNARVYGEANSKLSDYCRKKSLVLKVLAWNESLRKNGFKEDCLYLIRPDGYIALVDSDARAEKIQQYFNRITY